MRISGERGFTFLELFVTIAILGIVSAFATVKLNSFVAHNQLEKAAWKVLKDLSLARPMALKNDCPVIIKFCCSNQLQIHLDDNKDGVAQSGELQQTITLDAPISFGLPSTAPGVAPSGATLPGAGTMAGGNWHANGLTVLNDAIGKINSGSVYLKSARLSKVAYCISASSSAQNLKLFKWNGSSWSQL